MKANSKYFNYHTVFFVMLFTIIYNECDRSFPIKISDGSCVLRFCTEAEFNNKDCILDNQIVKTQYLNNIIIVGDPDSSNCPDPFITKYSNGDIVLLISNRYFEKKKIFWFKKKWRIFFWE